jgi:hypothetical protein
MDKNTLKTFLSRSMDVEGGRKKKGYLFVRRLKRMTPTVWGPVMWRVLFSTAWYCKDSQIDSFRDILLRLIPQLLPCHDCRLHFRMHRSEVTKKAKGEPRNAEHAFRWLYYLKDEVNRSLTPPVVSIPLKEFKARYNLHDGHILNDVDVADLLVLMAIEAKDLRRDIDFTCFCNSMADMLPVPLDSVLPSLMSDEPRNAITTYAVDMAHAVRKMRGLACRPLKHYKDWGNI